MNYFFVFNKIDKITFVFSFSAFFFFWSDLVPIYCSHYKEFLFYFIFLSPSLEHQLISLLIIINIIIGFWVFMYCDGRMDRGIEKLISVGDKIVVLDLGVLLGFDLWLEIGCGDDYGCMYWRWLIVYRICMGIWFSGSMGEMSESESEKWKKKIWK